jgi:hypothetical protein
MIVASRLLRKGCQSEYVIFVGFVIK